jgi:hypothetical protein
MAKSDTLKSSQGTPTGIVDELMAPKPYEFLNQRHTLYSKNYDRWNRRWKLIFGDVESSSGKRAFLPQGEYEDDDFYDDRVTLSEVVPEMPPVIRRIANKIFGEEIVRSWNDDDLSALEKNMDGRNTRAKTFMRNQARKVAVLGVMHVLCDKPAWPKGKKPKTLDDERSMGLRLPFFVAYSPLEVVNWSTDRNNNLEWALTRVIRYDMDDDMEAVTYVEFTKWERNAWTRWTFRAGGKYGARLQAVTGEENPGFDKPQPHNVGRVPLTPIYFDYVEPMIGQGLSDEAFRADLLKIRAESNLTWDAYVHAHPQLAFWTKRDPKADIGLGTSAVLKLDVNEDEDARYLTPEDNAFAVNEWLIENLIETTIRHQGVDPLGVISKKGVRQESGIKAAWSFKTSEEQILQNFAEALQSAEEHMFENAARLLDGNAQPFAARVFEEKFKGSVRYPKKFDLTSPKERMEQFIQARKHIKSKTLLTELALAIAFAYTQDLPSKAVDEIEKEIRAIDFTKEGQFEPGPPAPGFGDESDEGGEE